MKNYSIWQEDLLENKYVSLENDLDVDVLIIGAGLTGLSTAYFLLNKKQNVVILEKNVVGSGITSKSTAKISFLQEDMYSKIKFYRSYRDAFKYYEAQNEGLKELQTIIEKYHIDCDFVQSDSYLYTIKKKAKKIKKEEALLNSFFVETKQKKALPNGLIVDDAFYVDNVYTFNPLKYLNALAEEINKEIPIYENSTVTELLRIKDGYVAYSNGKQIKAKYVVLACHYPFFLFPFFFPMRCSLQKSYIAVKEDKTFDFNAINLDKPLRSIRYYNGKYAFNLSNTHNPAFKNNEAKNFQETNCEKAEYIWSNIDINTKDYLPYIGKLNKNLLIGTGYAAWGMINSHVAGKLLSDIILDNYNEYQKLFNPKRISYKSVLRYPTIIFSNAYSFIKNKLFKKKKYLKNIVFYKHTKEGKIAVYVDEKGTKHHVKTTCPHMKCNLIFNPVEKTWDCPCHGSRFDADGKCLESPSVYDINISKKA